MLINDRRVLVLALLLVGVILQQAFFSAPRKTDDLPRVIFPYDSRVRLLWPTTSSSPSALVTPSASIIYSLTASPQSPSPSALPSPVFFTHDEVWPLLVTVGDSLAFIRDANKQFGCISLAFAISLGVPRVHIRPTTDIFRAKSATFLRYLEIANRPDNELVMFADTFDVLFIRRPEQGEIVQKFMEITKGNSENAIVISGECSCFPPNAQVACDNSAKLFPEPFNYVNSGQVLGSVGALRKFLRGVQDAYSTPRNWQTDQDVVHMFCFGGYEINAASRGVQCFLDAKTEIFRSTFETVAQCPGFKVDKLVTIEGGVKAPCRFNPSKMCTTDPTTKGQPLALHYNGKNGGTLGGLLHNVETFRADVWGSGVSFDNSFLQKCDTIGNVQGGDEQCESYGQLCGKYLENGDIFDFHD